MLNALVATPFYIFHTWWIFCQYFNHFFFLTLFCPTLSCFKGTYFILLHPFWQCQLFRKGHCLSNFRSFHIVQVLKSPQIVKLYIREILVTLLMPVILKIKAFPHFPCDLMDFLACKISTFQSLKPSYVLVTWFSRNQQTAPCRCECFKGIWFGLGEIYILEAKGYIFRAAHGRLKQFLSLLAGVE